MGTKRPYEEDKGLSFDSTSLERLRAAMQKRFTEGGVGGASAAVYHHGEPAFEHCVGDLQLDSIVRIASMTKVITSVCALRLVEDGILHLHEDLTQSHLPELADVKVVHRKANGDLELKPRQNRITLHQLLTHTAGFSYPFITKQSGNEADEFAPVVGLLHDAYTKAEVWSIPYADGQTSEEFMRRLSTCPLAFEPGSKWLYGLNIDVAGIVVERATRKRLSEVMRDEVFVPLGMVDTGFHVPPEKLPRLADVWEPPRTGPGPVQKRGDTLERHPDSKDCFIYHKTRTWSTEELMCAGGAGLVSTLSDYSKFLHGLMASITGKPKGGQRPILSRRAAALIGADALAPSLPRSPMGPFLGGGCSHTLSMQVLLSPGLAGSLGTPGTLSWGGIFGTTFFMDVEEEIVAILLTQRYPNDEVDIRTTFQSMVLSSLR